MRVLLLMQLLTATHCRLFISIDNNATSGRVSVLRQDQNISILCEGPVSCLAIPEIQLTTKATSLTLIKCPPTLLRCVHKVAYPPSIVHVYFRYLTEPFTEKDIKSLSNEISLTIILKDTDTSLPTSAISSWRTLKRLVILGGNLQNLHANKISHNSLIELRFVQNNITSLPKDFFVGLSSLRTLFLLENRIEFIRAGTFKGLDNLENLFLDKIGLKSIEIGTFFDTPRLTILFSKGNPLKSLPNGLLTGLQSLEMLSISISSNTEHVKGELGANALSQLRKLRVVTLENFNVKSLPEDLFNGSNKVEIINLRSDKINNISSLTFSKLYSLKELNLENNVIHDLPSNIFDNISFLEFLSLDNNKIQRLSYRIFTRLSSLKVIEICNNELQTLPHGIFSTVTVLENLDLHNNSIKTMPEGIFSSLANLNTLDLSNNKIHYLPKEIFNDLNKLYKLNLSNNNIEQLDTYSFFGLINLRILDLSNNCFSHIPTEEPTNLLPLLYLKDKILASILDKEKHSPSYRFISPFTVLTNLQILDLSGNKIKNLYSGWDWDLRNVRLLNLSRNSFTDTQISSLDISNINIVMDFRDNNISTIILQFQKYLPSKDAIIANSTIILNSPVVCDCNSYGLYLRTHGARLSHEPQYMLKESKCIAPPHLNGKLLKDVSPTDLVCELSEHCPKNCSQCIIKSVTKEIMMECTELPLRLPEREDLNYPHNRFDPLTFTLSLIHQPDNIEDLDINKLNLSNTGLDHIAFEPNTYLKILDVSNNHLQTIPDIFFTNNITLYVANNPLNCDCSLTKNLKKAIVGDFELVTCADKVKLADIDVQELCNRKIALAGYICMGFMCGLFFLKFIITEHKKIKRKLRNLQRIVLRRGSEASLQIERRLDKAKEYDLFISFAHEDTDFVQNNLMPKVETEFKQKVCIHYRDWIAGELIADQIIESVENSRRTVIILTENFLLSEWSFLEFRTAHNLSIREGRPRVIMILPNKDVINSIRMTKDIKSYIAINTYLSWQDPDFWEKFKKLLPKKHRL